MERYRSERPSAAVLIAGAVLCIATMVLHPTDGADAMQRGNDAHVRFGVVIHALAILSLFLQVTGTAAVLERLGPRSVLTRAGWFALCSAALAASGAATISALTNPWIAQRLEGLDETAQTEVIQQFHLMHTVTLALTSIFYVGAIVFVASWGARMWLARIGPLWLRGIAPAVAALGVLGVAGGFLHPDVHSLILFTVGFGAWLVGLGAWLANGDAIHRG